ncbi:MAG: tetratricopeptide repeat protein [Planctomycetota bacterium]
MGRPPATFASLLVLLCAGLVYLPSLSGGYVYDDHRFVRMNPAVEEGASLADYLFRPETQAAGASHEGLYRPLRTISFRIGRLLGIGATPQRILSLLLHLANGVLVWLLLRRLLRDVPGWAPLLGALVFLLHPVCTESVAWISSRGDLLALTFMLGSLLLYLKEGAGPRAMSVLCFLFALLSKESALALPVLIAVADGHLGGLERVRRRLVSYAPYVAVLVGFLVLRFAVLGLEEFGQRGGVGLGTVEILLTLPSMLAYYLRAVLFPVGITFELRIETASSAPAIAAVGGALLAGLLLLARACRGRARAVSLAILWFLVALLPVTALQVLFPFKILVANRFAYPALAGAAVLAAALSRRRVSALFVLVVVAVLAPLTWVRVGEWKSERALWSSVLAKDPDHPVALFGLGDDAMRRGEWEEARRLLIRAVEADPTHPQVHAYLGDVFEHLAAEQPRGSVLRGRLFAGALYAYRSAVDLWKGGATDDPHLYRPTLLNAAYLAAVLRETRLAREYAQAFLESRRPLPDSPAYLAVMLNRMVRLERSLRGSGETAVADGLSELIRQLRR